MLLIVVLICIFLMTDEGKPLLYVYWSFNILICDVSVHAFAHFSIGMFVLLLICSSFTIWNRTLSNIHSVNIFSCLVTCFVTLLIVCFDQEKFLILM